MTGHFVIAENSGRSKGKIWPVMIRLPTVISLPDYASGIQLLDFTKLTVNWENVNDVTIF